MLKNMLLYYYKVFFLPLIFESKDDYQEQMLQKVYKVKKKGNNFSLYLFK